MVSDLDTDGIRVAFFQTPNEQAVGVPAQRIKRDLEAELDQFRL